MSIKTIFLYLGSKSASLIKPRNSEDSLSFFAKAITAFNFQFESESLSSFILRLKSEVVTDIIFPVPGSSSNLRRNAGGAATENLTHLLPQALMLYKIFLSLSLNYQF